MEGIIFLVLICSAALVVVAFSPHLAIYLIRITRASRNPERTRPKPSALINHFILSVIAFIFAAIAIPNFFKTNCPPWPFEHPDCRQSEAKTNLGAIYVAQLSYFSNANTYASGPDAFKLLQWDPVGQNRYAFYCQGTMIPGKPPKRWQFWLIRNYPLPSDSNWPVALKPASSKTGFTCMAVGNIDNDETLDVWSISDGKILRNDLNDLNNKSWTYDFR